MDITPRSTVTMRGAIWRHRRHDTLGMEWSFTRGKAATPRDDAGYRRTRTFSVSKTEAPSLQRWIVTVKFDLDIQFDANVYKWLKSLRSDIDIREVILRLK